MESKKINTKGKKLKVMVSKSVYESLNNVKSELKKRGVVVGTDPLEILDYIFENMNRDLLNEYIDQKTPDEYKIKHLIQDDKFKENLKKLIDSYSKKKKSSSEILNTDSLI